MGAWDETVFGNDDAADFSGDISDLTSYEDVVGRLGFALDDVLGNDGYLDNYEASVGVAAAALIAAWDRPELLPKTPYEPETWPAFGQPLPAELRAKAAQVFERVLTPDPDTNEFYDLWDEANLWDAVVADIQRYRNALAM
jgi:hypothetical protein